MMFDWPILSVVTFLPLLGAAFLFVIRGEEELVARNARAVALFTTIVTFLISLILWVNFDTSSAAFQFVEDRAWLGGTINGFFIMMFRHLRNVTGV